MTIPLRILAVVLLVSSVLVGCAGKKSPVTPDEIPPEAATTGRTEPGDFAVDGKPAAAGEIVVEDLEPESGPGTESADMDSTGNIDDGDFIERDPSSLDGEFEPCPDMEEQEGLDRMQKKFENNLCRSARWFDALWGNPRAFEQASANYGLLGAGGLWDEQDGFSGKGRFRAHVDLPQMNNRLNLVMGRLPSDSLIQEDEGDPIPPAVEESENEWLLGLEYRPLGNDRLALGAGVKVDAPPEAYVKLRYRTTYTIGQKRRAAFKVTPFWQQGGKEFGLNARFDWELHFGKTALLRWTLSGTQHGETDGVRFRFGPTLYHRVGRLSSFAHDILITGQTEREVADEDYQFFSRFRRPIFKDFFFMTVGLGATYRKRLIVEDREIVPLAGLFFELQFGQFSGANSAKKSAEPNRPVADEFDR